MVMNALTSFTLEYGFKTTPRLLYTAISTPEGLSRWFADMVTMEGEDVFVFKWEGSEQKARLLRTKENEFVQFAWLDELGQEEHSMEMQIRNEPVSSEVALLITDQSDENDMDLSQRVWDAQLKKLQRLFSN